MKKLVVVDMQNDFVTGSLKNPMAEEKLPVLEEALKVARDHGLEIIFTRDTHAPAEEYLKTSEGKHLPVPHCEKGSKGWDIVDSLKPLDNEKVIDKDHFMFTGWKDYISAGDEVFVMGTVTEICVISNVLALKSIEGVEVTVLQDACIPLDRFRGDVSMDIMESCQANIVRGPDFEVFEALKRAADKK